MQLKCTGPRTVLAIVGVAASCWLIQPNEREHSWITISAPATNQRGDTSLQPSGPRYQVVNDVQLVYQAPADPRGTLLLFHGCQHSSTDWWPSSSDCSICTGLPEEVRITQQAVQQGYAAVALSSQMRQPPRCWDTSWPPQPSSDLDMVKGAVRALLEQQGWIKLPLYALGASSGGAFALLLASQMPLQGVCCQIMSVPQSMLGLEPLDPQGASWRYPPTVFTHMTRDKRTALGVPQNIELLQQKGTAVLELPIDPQPLTPQFLSHRIAEIDSEVSAAIHGTLLQAGMLDKQGFLKDDPRQTANEWQALLRQQVPATQTMNLKHDESAIHEELNLAYAGHELISDTINSTLLFFESQLG